MFGNLKAVLRNHLEAIVADRAAARARMGARGPVPVEVPEGVTLAPDLAARVETFRKAVTALANAAAKHTSDWCGLADLFAAGATMAGIKGRAEALRAERCELLRRELDLLDQERTLLGQLADSAAAAPREVVDGLRTRAREAIARHMPAVTQELLEAFCIVVGVLPPPAMGSRQ